MKAHGSPLINWVIAWTWSRSSRPKWACIPMRSRRLLGASREIGRANSMMMEKVHNSKHCQKDQNAEIHPKRTSSLKRDRQREGFAQLTRNKAKKANLCKNSQIMKIGLSLSNKSMVQFHLKRKSKILKAK